MRETMNFSEKDSLTDEELRKLIACVEREEMLRAPSYLRDEIMGKARSAQQPGKSNRIQLFLYGAKIMTAAAAAVAMLLVMPRDIGMNRQIMERDSWSEETEERREPGNWLGFPDRERSREREPSVARVIDRTSTQLCKVLNEMTSMLIWEEKEYDEKEK